MTKSPSCAIAESKAPAYGALAAADVSAAAPHWRVVALIGAAYLPLLGLQAYHLAVNPRYGLVLLTPLAAAALLWLRWPSKAGIPLSLTLLLRLETWLLSAGLLLLAASVLCWSPWLATASAILSLGSLLIYASRRQATSCLVWAWSLLWLLLPPPFGWDQTLAARMVERTTQLSSVYLDVFGVHHLALVDKIVTPTGQAALSNVFCWLGSPFFLLAIAAVYAVAMRRPLLHVCLLLASAPLLAAAGAAALTYGTLAVPALQPLANNVWPLQVSLVVVFAAALYSADGLFLFLLLPASSQRNPITRFWNRVVRAGRPSRRLPSANAGPPAQPHAAAKRLVEWQSSTVARLAACLLLVQIALSVVFSVF